MRYVCMGTFIIWLLLILVATSCVIAGRLQPQPEVAIYHPEWLPGMEPPADIKCNGHDVTANLTLCEYDDHGHQIHLGVNRHTGVIAFTVIEDIDLPIGQLLVTLPKQTENTIALTGKTYTVVWMKKWVILDRYRKYFSFHDRIQNVTYRPNTKFNANAVAFQYSEKP